jgi:uncharacterized membrane protein
MFLKKYTERHIRSLFKTLTIRILFTLSHILNGFIISGMWSTGFKIAATALLLNSGLYYLHERFWNTTQWNRKYNKLLSFIEGIFRSIGKSLTWRILITMSNVLIPYFTTGSFGQALAFLGLATIINIAIYYLHERTWNKIPYGKKHDRK